jgi:hypothetical protein
MSRIVASSEDFHHGFEGPFLLQSSAWMTTTESPREAALQRIAEQQARIEKQRTLIAALRANGSATRSAEQVLRQMEGALSALRDSLHLYPG